MVSDSTVLIVGAGGSQPYGYPSGGELRRDIIKSLGAPPTSGIHRGLIEMGFDRKAIDSFRYSFKHAGENSIDAFLEKRAKFAAIGKAAIAAALIPQEKGSVLFEGGTEPDEDKDWYRYLYNRLDRNLKAGKSDRLTILTFNYDRSLDHFLYVAFKYSYGIRGAELRQKLDKLEIFHLHGMLSTLPLFGSADNPPRRYGASQDYRLVKVAANAIRIVHEATDNDPSFITARDRLVRARRIGVLGFGYAPQNVSRLLSGGWLNNSRSALTIGSAFGLTNSEKNEISSMFNGRITLGERTHDCLTFLRENVGLIN